MQGDSTTATAEAQAPERAPAAERARTNLRAAARLLDSHAGVADLVMVERLVQFAIDDLREAAEKDAARGEA